MSDFEQARGDTWFFTNGGCCVPVFFLDGKRVVLLDSGRGGRDLDALLTLIKSRGLRVRAILTSHAHIDHVGGHRAIQSLHGAELCMSLFNAAVLENPLGLSAYFYGETYREALADGQSMFCRADRLILPGQTDIEIDGARFSILPLPGHAPEHMGFITPDGVSYLGDVLMSPGTASGMRLPYALCCEEDLASKRGVAALDCACHLLAHQGCFSLLEPVIEQNLALWDEKLRLVEALAREEQTMDSITAAVLQAVALRCRTPFQIMSAGRSVRSMVQYLVDCGRLSARVEWGVFHYVLPH